MKIWIKVKIDDLSWPWFIQQQKRGELMLQNPQVWLFLTEFSIENDISLWEKEKLIHSVTLIDNKLQVRCLWKPTRWGKAMNSTVACRALCFSGPFINIWTGSQMRPQVLHHVWFNDINTLELGWHESIISSLCKFLESNHLKQCGNKKHKWNTERTINNQVFLEH